MSCDYLPPLQNRIVTRCDAAVKEAKSDVETQKERVGREDTQEGGEVLDEDALEEVHEQVHEMIKMEKGELEMIKEQCFSDIATIGG